MIRAISGLICFGLLVATVCGATVRVPADYPTINAAYGAAAAGDEIIVSPGVYNEGLSIEKKIILRSTYDGKDWGIVERTVMKSTHGPTIYDQGSLIRLASISAVQGTVISGFTLTREPIPLEGNTRNITARGIDSSGVNATIENCIIENHVAVGGTGGPQDVYGGAIYGIYGTIQNNIIRNNYADSSSVLFDCRGVVRNNIIYNNTAKPHGSAIYGGNCTFLNNTLFNSGDVSLPGGSCLNSILWSDNQSAVNVYAATIRSCVVKGYPAASGVITEDPKFVDPAKGDFRLQADSPCIDAGITTEGVTADLNGVQRGLKAVKALRGDGSGVDIGAFEFIPKPVAVWLPHGGPDEIRAGDHVTVAWQMEEPTAGSAILLQLYDGLVQVADLGAFWNPTANGYSNIRLPSNLAAGASYTIRGVSSWNHALWFDSPFLRIDSAGNAVNPGAWNGYH